MALSPLKHACKTVMGRKACAGGLLDGLGQVRCFLTTGEHELITTSKEKQAVLTEGAKILLQASANAEAAIGKVDLRFAAQQAQTFQAPWTQQRASGQRSQCLLCQERSCKRRHSQYLAASKHSLAVFVQTMLAMSSTDGQGRMMPCNEDVAA